jgi:hypothetical protein
MRKVTVEYSVATYHGTVDVFASDDADDEKVLLAAKLQLRMKAGTLPFGSQSFRVKSEEKV